MNTYSASYSPIARALAAASTLGLLAFLTACSGSVTVDTNWPSPTVPPTPWVSVEPISSFGVISAPGSVSINGVRYDTGAASVTMNGQPAFTTDLRTGHTVALRGNVEESGTRGTASQIEYEAAVVGPVEAVDASRHRVIVLGQTVLSNTDTIYDPRIATGSLDGVTVGSRVQISGFLNADGLIVATRIEPAEASAALQVSGRVAGLDLANQLFTLDRLTVDYGSTLVIDLPGGMPTEGLTVIVRGSLANGLLTAQAITGLPDAGFGMPNRRAHAGGWITRFASTSDFDINGQPVSASSSTAFVNGTAADLGTNVLVTIDGRVSSDGQRIRAQRVTFGRLPGSVVGQSYALTDFDDVAVSGGFKTDITGSSAFLVEVAAEAGLVNRLDVAQHESLLEIGIRSGAPYEVDTLEARVSLPALNRLTVIGLSYADLNNFTQTSLDLNVIGLSFVRGQALAIGSLTAAVNGASFADLDDIEPLQHATVNVSGASYVTLNMGEGSTLAGSVTGASSLQYYGTNVTVNVTTDATSTVRRLGDTRP